MHGEHNYNRVCHEETPKISEVSAESFAILRGQRRSSVERGPGVLLLAPDCGPPCATTVVTAQLIWPRCLVGRGASSLGQSRTLSSRSRLALASPSEADVERFVTVPVDCEPIGVQNRRGSAKHPRSLSAGLRQPSPSGAAPKPNLLEGISHMATFVRVAGPMGPVSSRRNLKRRLLSSSPLRGSLSASIRAVIKKIPAKLQKLLEDIAVRIAPLKAQGKSHKPRLQPHGPGIQSHCNALESQIKREATDISNPPLVHGFGLRGNVYEFGRVEKWGLDLVAREIIRLNSWAAREWDRATGSQNEWRQGFLAPSTQRGLRWQQRNAQSREWSQVQPVDPVRAMEALDAVIAAADRSLPPGPGRTAAEVAARVAESCRGRSWGA
ncbi:unnamed protein product [Prorocentrum cordatum]|uniref:Uncharacterized protein n=1 Tax=Prorocentrum cordatum TaxID=2364126 RepID=A0ABN9V4P5_9DINO|nr:unnamed protein product [Polarella glacialis]